MSNGHRSFFFGATLSEIGFILFFALLLFAFYQKQADSQIIKEEKDQIELLVEELTVKEKQLEAFEQLSKLSEEVQDRFFNELIPAIELEVKNEALASENEELRTELEELKDVRERLNKIAKENHRPEKEIQQALALTSELAKELGEDFDSLSPSEIADAIAFSQAVREFNDKSDSPITNAETLKERLAAARGAAQLQQANNNLRGQVVNLTGRLGGRDLPPCWADQDTGRIEYLFNIVIYDEGLLLSRAAPDYRTVEYSQLANTQQLTAGLLDLDTFRTLSEPILEFTDSQNCRHYVSIFDRSKNSYKYTLTIEDYFYKYVNRS